MTAALRGVFQLKANKVGDRPVLGIFTKDREAFCSLESINKFNDYEEQMKRNNDIPNSEH
jgi:hypothetical protein